MTQLTQRKEEPGHKPTKVEALKRLEAQREKDNEQVTGVFRYIEHPGGTLRFRFHKYEGDGFPQYELRDGQIYKIPRMVARHLNKEVHYKKYSHLDQGFDSRGPVQTAADGRAGSSSMVAVDKVPRCEFKSLEFMDEDLELNPVKLTEVRKG